ncbi:MAG: PilZ domain-containing protein [Desulfuromonadales bacterium]|jgi:uncharacterized protein (TIGR02266 family)
MSVSDPPEFTVEQKSKRRATRAPLIVEKLPVEDGQKTFFGYAKNLSRGGLFIATVKPRDPGDVFTIEFSLPVKPKKAIRCRCEVVWKYHFQRKISREPGMGLRFLDLSAADGDVIETWVEDQAEKRAE